VVTAKKKNDLFLCSYTKNILLNKGIHGWMAAQDQPHEIRESRGSGNT
jgi:hypothetical protein